MNKEKVDIFSLQYFSKIDIKWKKKQNKKKTQNKQKQRIKPMYSIWIWSKYQRKKWIF